MAIIDQSETPLHTRRGVPPDQSTLFPGLFQTTPTTFMRVVVLAAPFWRSRSVCNFRHISIVRTNCNHSFGSSVLSHLKYSFLIVKFYLAIAQVANENPDQPQAARSDHQNEVKDQTSCTTLLHCFSSLSYLCEQISAAIANRPAAIISSGLSVIQ